MPKSSKKLKVVEEEIDSGSDDYGSLDDDDDQDFLNQNNGEDDSENDEMDMDEIENEDDDEDENEDSDDVDDDDEEDDGDEEKDDNKPAEMEELEKEYMDLRHEEQDLLRNLRRHKDEDLLKGEAVKNQRALWDKTLELRFLLQKGFSSSNRLPQEPVRSLFCNSGDGVKEAYSDLIDSSKKTLDSMLELQEALLEKNPSISQATDGNSKHVESGNTNEGDDEWLQISQMHSRMVSFRDKSVDKWQRKTQVTTGAAAIKGKLQAFNQNISEQVATYMRDPSRMIKGMQQIRSAVSIFGTDPDSVGNNPEAVANAEGDPELLEDSDFYQLLLKELFEAHSTSSETAFYALKRLQKKKRKIVDRRASKSRKIRYNVHEKIVNFMAPQNMNFPPEATTLFEDLFGLKSHAPTSAA